MRELSAQGATTGAQEPITLITHPHACRSAISEPSLAISGWTPVPLQGIQLRHLRVLTGTTANDSDIPDTTITHRHRHRRATVCPSPTFPGVPDVPDVPPSTVDATFVNHRVSIYDVISQLPTRVPAYKAPISQMSN